MKKFWLFTGIVSILVLLMSCSMPISNSIAVYYVRTGSGLPNYYTNSFELTDQYVILHGYYDSDSKQYIEKDVTIVREKLIEIVPNKNK